MTLDPQYSIEWYYNQDNNPWTNYQKGQNFINGEYVMNSRSTSKNSSHRTSKMNIKTDKSFLQTAQQ